MRDCAVTLIGMNKPTMSQTASPLTMAQRSEHWKAMLRSIFPEDVEDIDMPAGVIFGLGTVVDL